MRLKTLCEVRNFRDVNNSVVSLLSFFFSSREWGGGVLCDVTGSKEAYQSEALHIFILFLSSIICTRKYLIILEQQVPKVIPDLETSINDYSAFNVSIKYMNKCFQLY